MIDRKQALINLRQRVRDGKSGLGLTSVFKADQSINASRAHHGSLDAAKALHEAVLPGWTWSIEPDEATVYCEPYKHPIDGFAQDPARAWLLAILEAMIAQEADA